MNDKATVYISAYKTKDKMKNFPMRGACNAALRLSINCINCIYWLVPQPVLKLSSVLNVLFTNFNQTGIVRQEQSRN